MAQMRRMLDATPSPLWEGGPKGFGWGYVPQAQCA